MDLSSITKFLTDMGLSQTGALAAGMGLVVLVMFLRSRLGTPAPPALPTAPASPATNPLNLGPQFPIINSVLQALGIIPKGTVGTTADIPHTLIAQLSAEMSGITNAKIAEHAAALADLGAVPGPLEARAIAPTGK